MKTKALVGIPLLLVLSMAVQSNNGMTEVTFSIPLDFYVDCLGENVVGKVDVVAKTHTFETPSGTSHLVDNWKTFFEFVGASTGREWVGKGASPGGGHVVKTGEKFFFTEKLKVFPVPVYGIADGPSWRYNVVVQWRWDEEGNLVKDFFNFATGDFNCLGRN